MIGLDSGEIRKHMEDALAGLGIKPDSRVLDSRVLDSRVLNLYNKIQTLGDSETTSNASSVGCGDESNGKCGEIGSASLEDWGNVVQVKIDGVEINMSVDSFIKTLLELPFTF